MQLQHNTTEPRGQSIKLRPLPSRGLYGLMARGRSPEARSDTLTTSTQRTLHQPQLDTPNSTELSASITVPGSDPELYRAIELVTRLEQARTAGRVETIRTLARQINNPSLRSHITDIISAKDPEGKTTLMRSAARGDAGRFDATLEMFKQVFDNDEILAAFINETDAAGMTALHHVTKATHPKDASLMILMALKEFGADINAVDNQGNNFIHHAASAANFPILRHAVRSEQYPDLLAATNKQGQSPKDLDTHSIINTLQTSTAGHTQTFGLETGTPVQVSADGQNETSGVTPNDATVLATFAQAARAIGAR